MFGNPGGNFRVHYFIKVHCSRLKEEIFLFTKVIIIFNSRALFKNSLVFAAALTLGEIETAP